jgi:hypothetical protein
MKSDADRLKDLIVRDEVLEFFQASDKEHPELQWTVYGSIPTNEVFVRADARGTVFVQSSPSELLYPVMADRRFGIDVADNFVAEKLSAEIWSANRKKILSALGKL